MNVIFYLKGTVKAWFDNNEEELTSWTICKTKLDELFVQPAGCQPIKNLLPVCAGSCLTYSQDVLALCRKVDAKMTEVDRRTSNERDRGRRI